MKVEVKLQEENILLVTASTDLRTKASQTIERFTNNQAILKAEEWAETNKRKVLKLSGTGKVSNENPNLLSHTWTISLVPLPKKASVPKKTAAAAPKKKPSKASVHKPARAKTAVKNPERGNGAA